MPFEAVDKQIKTATDDILTELQLSIEKNTVVGILLKDTREFITTAVSDIERLDNGDILITVMDEDLHGYPISRKKFYISNIDRTIHFNISFDDPQYVKERRKEKFKT